MDKAAAYRKLIGEYGAEAVADRLLAKWRSDPDAAGKWERLACKVAEATEPRPTMASLLVLQKLADGRTYEQAAWELGKSPNTVRRQLVAARQRMGKRKGAAIVADAIRKGWIE